MLSKRFTAIAALLVVAAATQVRAQTPSQQKPPVAPRAFTFADTMGANFDVADSATAKGTPADYDYMVGLWTFRFQQRNPDGTFQPAFNGHWLFDKKRSIGAMIEDHWRSDSPARPWDSGTWSYRTFNARLGIWTFVGVGTESGEWQPGLSWSDGKDLFVIQHSGRALIRFRYFELGNDHFKWRADLTPDGGKTWIRDYWTMEGTRIGK